MLSENLQPRVFGTSVGIIAAINGGIGGVDGYVGGLMSETLGFRSIFAVVLVLTAVAAGCILKTVPKGRPQHVRGAMDWWGAGSLSVFLVFITYFVSGGSAAGWTAPGTLALLAGTVASFAAFWMIEKRRSHPLIAVHHLRSRQVWPVIATTVLTLAGIFAVIELHRGAAQPGQPLRLRAQPVPLRPAVPHPGRAHRRLRRTRSPAGSPAAAAGSRPSAPAPALSLACAMAAALFSGNQVAVMIAVASLGIFYNGFFLTAINGLSVLLSPKEAPASLPGINGASFGIGASLGVVIVAPFAAQATSAGYATALWISVAITAAAFIVSLFVAAPKGETL